MSVRLDWPHTCAALQMFSFVGILDADVSTAKMVQQQLGAEHLLLDKIRKINPCEFTLMTPAAVKCLSRTFS